MSVNIKYLQGWIGVIGFVAIINTISCFISHLHLSDKIYVSLPNEGYFNTVLLRSYILRILRESVYLYYTLQYI